MKNYNKIGYSVQEVAQIFGCTPSTIRKYVYDGYLKADVSLVKKRNSVRIRREHLVEYMTEHKGRFSVETLKQFGVSMDSSISVSEVIKQQKSPDFAPGAYAAKDLSELDGAWSTEKKNELRTLETPEFSIPLMVQQVCHSRNRELIQIGIQSTISLPMVKS